jgi:hypothetical protein
MNAMAVNDKRTISEERMVMRFILLNESVLMPLLEILDLFSLLGNKLIDGYAHVAIRRYEHSVVWVETG